MLSAGILTYLGYVNNIPWQKTVLYFQLRNRPGLRSTVVYNEKKMCEKSPGLLGLYDTGDLEVKLL